MKHIFAKQTKSGFLSMDENKNPVLENTINSYSVTKNKNNFVISEIYRKNQQPKKIKVIRISKRYKSTADIVRDVQADKIKLNSSHETRFNNKTVVTQSNHLTKIKARPQIIALVNVYDTKKRTASQEIGFSYKTTNLNPNKAEIEKARQEAIHSALFRYADKHNIQLTYDSTRLQGKIIEERYIYIKKDYN